MAPCRKQAINIVSGRKQVPLRHGYKIREMMRKWLPNPHFYSRGTGYRKQIGRKRKQTTAAPNPMLQCAADTQMVAFWEKRVSSTNFIPKGILLNCANRFYPPTYS